MAINNQDLIKSIVNKQFNPFFNPPKSYTEALAPIKNIEPLIKVSSQPDNATVKVVQPGDNQKVSVSNKVDNNSIIKNIIAKTLPTNQKVKVAESLKPKTFSATYYDPLDPNQTKKNPDGIGAFGTPVRFGDVATADRSIPQGTLIKVKELEDVITPYGQGVFRVNDKKNVRYNTGEPGFDIAITSDTPNAKELSKRIGNNKLTYETYQPEPNISVTGAEPTPEENQGILRKIISGANEIFNPLSESNKKESTNFLSAKNKILENTSNKKELLAGITDEEKNTLKNTGINLGLMSGTVEEVGSKLANELKNLVGKAKLPTGEIKVGTEVKKPIENIISLEIPKDIVIPKNLEELPSVFRGTMGMGEINKISSKWDIMYQPNYGSLWADTAEDASKYSRGFSQATGMSSRKPIGNEPFLLEGKKLPDGTILPVKATNLDTNETLNFLTKKELPEKTFATAVKESPETLPQTAKELGKLDTTYQPLSNEKIMTDAKNLVAKSPAEAVNFVTNNKEVGAEHTATAIELIRHFQQTGAYKEAADIADNIATKLTKAGQTIQAAKLYQHLSPESILIDAQKAVKKANENKFIFQKPLKLDEATTKKITDLATQMRDATDPNVKTELAGTLQTMLSALQRTSIGRKISSAQTLAQLLNPKTILTRNPLGNEIFYRLDRINKYIATPIDWARSALTGADRTITFRTEKQGEFWSNWLKGLTSGWKGEMPGGIASQYELYAPAFTNKWNPLTWAEKALGASIKSFDFGAYMRAKNQTIGEMAYLRALNEGKKGQALRTAAKEYAQNIDTNALQIAEDYGKYITFQDSNVLGKTLAAIKRGLNAGRSFGLGDLVLKYTKTPAALVMRSLEYSPAGFLKSMYDIASPLLKGKAVNVRDVELGLSRAITGTVGLSGLGYYLADKGIITAKPSENRNIAALQKTTGVTQYQVNLTALKRWVTSGFQDTSIEPGDKMISYDWAQPVALSLSLGANFNQNLKEEELAEKKSTLAEKSLSGAGTVAQSLSEAAGSIAEQPLFTGLTTFFGGQGDVSQNVVDGVMATVESMPASFTPTLLSQMRQFTDNVSRSTYDKNILQRAINRVKNKVPGLQKDLPITYNVLGKQNEIYYNPNLFNVFLNPGFIKEYKPTPAANVVLQLYNETGETQQAPKIVSKSLTLYDNKFPLSAEQMSKMQKNIGIKTDIVFTALANDEKFESSPNSDKINILNYMLGEIWNSEKFNTLTPDQRKLLIEKLDDKKKAQLAKDLMKYSIIKSPDQK